MPENVKWLDMNCPNCGGQLNSWDVKASRAVGYKEYQICETCLCKEYDLDKDEFRAQLEKFFGVRPCMGI